MTETAPPKTKPERALDQFIGYYEWEGLPCRIRKDETHDHILISEIYIPGEGYLPFSMTDIILEAYPVGEKTYQQMLVKNVLRRKSAH
jgi:hypothetical protein